MAAGPSSRAILYIARSGITLALNPRALPLLTLHLLISSTGRPAACFAFTRAAGLGRVILFLCSLLTLGILAVKNKLRKLK